MTVTHSIVYAVFISPFLIFSSLATQATCADHPTSGAIGGSPHFPIFITINWANELMNTTHANRAGRHHNVLLKRKWKK